MTVSLAEQLAWPMDRLFEGNLVEGTMFGKVTNGTVRQVPGRRDGAMEMMENSSVRLGEYECGYFTLNSKISEISKAS